MIEIFLMLSLAVTASPVLNGGNQLVIENPPSYEQELQDEIDKLLTGVSHGG